MLLDDTVHMRLRRVALSLQQPLAHADQLLELRLKLNLQLLYNCNKKPGGDYGLPAAMALADQSIAELTETVRSTLTEQGALQVSDPTR